MSMRRGRMNGCLRSKLVSLTKASNLIMVITRFVSLSLPIRHDRHKAEEEPLIYSCHGSRQSQEEVKPFDTSCFLYFNTISEPTHSDLYVIMISIPLVTMSPLPPLLHLLSFSPFLFSMYQQPPPFDDSPPSFTCSPVHSVACSFSTSVYIHLESNRVGTERT